MQNKDGLTDAAPSDCRSMPTRRGAVLVWVAGALASVVVATATIGAHKGNVSKYTYNDDVYPILKEKCGRCHADGGPTPMSLLSYQDEGGAVAWAESIREMLVADAMPPWYADPSGPPVKNNHQLTPRELDTLITWATGGTPQGDLNKKPAPVSAQVRWTLGPPDLAIEMEKAHTLPAGEMHATVEFTLATNLAEAKWVKAADLLPGTPSMVRRATIAVEKGPVLAVWEPGDDGATAPGGTAFKIPAGATLRVQMRYKKGWQDEQKDTSDRSTVGLYFTDEPLSGRDIQSVVIATPKSGSQPGVEGTLATAGRVLAIRPEVDQPYDSVDIQAVAASGRRVPLLMLRGVRPEWPRRYWLVDPVDLPSGTRIEVTAQAAAGDAGPLGVAETSPLQVSLDFVPQ